MKIFFISFSGALLSFKFFFGPLSPISTSKSDAGKPIKGPWKVYNFDFEDLSRIPQLPHPSAQSATATAPARKLKLFTSTSDPTLSTTVTSKQHEGQVDNGPIFYRGILRIEGDLAQPVTDAAGQLHLADTFLSTHGLGKGVVWVNGFNLGWYWPTMGPQMTLYVPGPVLKPGDNDILILEVEKVVEAEDTVHGRNLFYYFTVILGSFSVK
jgi:beta-galactosidase